MPGPRVKTRGFLASLTGLILGAPGTVWDGRVTVRHRFSAFSLVLPLQGASNGGRAFPGAASRVPRDLPRAILGRPFRAARTQTHDRGVGFSRALCPPRPGTGSCPVLCPPRAGVAAKRPGVESCIPLPISGSNSSCLAVPLLRGKLRELAEKRVHDGRLRFHRHLAGTQPGLVSAQHMLGGRRQIAKAPVGL